jgi:IS605 OrfB family transposase
MAANDKLTHTIKIPIKILEPDEEKRKEKYRYLNKSMEDSRYHACELREFFLGDIPNGKNMMNYVMNSDVVIPNCKNPKSEKSDRPMCFDELALENSEEVEEFNNTRITRKNGEYTVSIIEAGSVKPASLIYQISKQIIKDKKLDVPDNILATLSSKTANLKKNDITNYRNGTKSYSTFKQPFLLLNNSTTKIQKILIRSTGKRPDEQFLITPGGLGKQNIIFLSKLSYKDADWRIIIDRIINKQYKFNDSRIIKTKKGKLKFCLSYSFDPPVASGLDKKKVCGVDLGHNTPIVCGTNFNGDRLKIGSKAVVLSARAKFDRMKYRKQKRAGFKSKSVKWDVSEVEEHWVDTYYHTLTRNVINFCHKNKCGTINLEDLDKLREEELAADGSRWRRVVWVPSKIRSMIKYKAMDAGIDVNIINPRNTSRMCFKCKYIDINNRKERNFKCLQCGYEADADINASRNIASKQKE